MDKTSTKRRGPKPQGDQPMTPAERQRKRRAAIKAAGGRTFLMEISINDLRWLELEVQQTGRPIAEVLRQVIGLSLHRYGQVFERSAELAHLGASTETLEAFLRLHAFPEVPTLEELAELAQAGAKDQNNIKDK